MGHIHYLTGQYQDAKAAYERTFAYTSDAKDVHTIYLRLASIYLREQEVRNKRKILFIKTSFILRNYWVSNRLCFYPLLWKWQRRKLFPLKAAPRKISM